MDAAEIWRRKADEEVRAAYAHLDDYTDEGQSILKAEFERRELTPLDEMAEVDTDIEDSATSEDVPRHPLVRLWRGRYSLPVAYWGWGMGGALAWAVVWNAVERVTALDDSAGLGIDFVLFVLLIATLQLAYVVAVLTGIWRSADRYRGRPVWAVLAKVAVAAAAARSVVQVAACTVGLST